MCMESRVGKHTPVLDLESNLNVQFTRQLCCFKKLLAMCLTEAPVYTLIQGFSNWWVRTHMPEKSCLCPLKEQREDNNVIRMIMPLVGTQGLFFTDLTCGGLLRVLGALQSHLQGSPCLKILGKMQ